MPANPGLWDKPIRPGARNHYLQQTDLLGWAHVLFELWNLEWAVGQDEQAYEAYTHAEALYKRTCCLAKAISSGILIVLIRHIIFFSGR